MDKADIAITVAAGVLGFLMNSGTPKANTTPTQNKAVSGFEYVDQNVYLMESAYSTPNVKEVTVKWLNPQENSIFVSKEYIHCVNKEHKILEMQYIVNGRLDQSEIVTFPYWEKNKPEDELVYNHVCRRK